MVFGDEKGTQDVILCGFETLKQKIEREKEVNENGRGSRTGKGLLKKRSEGYSNGHSNILWINKVKNFLCDIKLVLSRQKGSYED